MLVSVMIDCSLVRGQGNFWQCMSYMQSGQNVLLHTKSCLLSDCRGDKHEWNLTPWLLCWHSCVCQKVATPFSALLTYPCMSWYYVWENLCKIGSSKDFLVNFFCFLAVLLLNQFEMKQKTLQQYLTLSMISQLEKRHKTTKSSAQGVCSFIAIWAVKGLR